MLLNIRPVPAPTLTNLAATPSVRAVVLTWDKPTDTTYAGAEIWSASSSTLGSAVKIGTVTTNTFTDSTPSVNPVSNRYYWVRAINIYGRTDGAWSNMATAKSLLNTNLDIAAGAVQAANLSVAAIDPTTGNLTARSITSTMIQAGAVTANEIAANTITSREIWSGYVYTNTLNASQITAGQMSADRIDVTNLRVGATNLTTTMGGDNLVNNSSFEVQNTSDANRPNGFYMYNNGSYYSLYISVAGRTGGKAFGIRAGAANSNNTWGVQSSNTFIEADGTIGGVRGGWQYGKTYVMSFKARKVNGANMKAIALRWNFGPATTTVLSNPVLSTSWQTYSFRIKWPTSGNIESAGQFYIDCNWTESGASIAAGDEFHVDELIIQEGDVGDEWFPSAVEAQTRAQNAAISSFTPFKTYDFNGTAQGWGAASGCTMAVNQNTITVTATNNDPIINTGVTFPGSKYDKIRVRFRRTAGSGWDGSVFYSNANHGENGAYGKNIPDPTVGQGNNYVVAEWDMATSLNPSDWASGNVTELRLDLGAAAGDSFDIDWISIGRYGVGSDTGVQDVTLVGDSNMLITGNRAQKMSGASAWDSQVKSIEGYTGGAYATAKIDVGGLMMFGLNTDPDTNSSYNTIDLAIYTYSDGTLYPYINGINFATSGIGTWAVGDVLGVRFNSSTAYWEKNGTVLFSLDLSYLTKADYRDMLTALMTKPVYFDSSFADVNAALSNIRFGPMSSNFTSSTKGLALNDDPAIENPNAWSIQGNITINTGAGAPNTSGDKYFYSSASQLDAKVFTNKRMAIDPNKTYSLSAKLFQDGTNDRNMYVIAEFYDVNGNHVSTGWGGSYSGYVFGGVPPASTFTQCGGQFGAGTARPIPAQVRTCVIGVWFNYSGNGSTTTSWQAAQDIRLEQVITTALLDPTVTANIADRLSKSAQNVLSGGAGISAGTLTWDGNGNRTGGYGVGITRNGLVGYNSSGNATITVDATTGNVVVSGTVYAAAGLIGGMSISNGALCSGGFTDYIWPTAKNADGSYVNGVYLGPQGLLLGNANNGKYFQVDYAGGIYAPGLQLVNGQLTLTSPILINPKTSTQFSVTLSSLNVNKANGSYTSNPIGPTISNGTQPYTYSWTFTSQTGSNIQMTSAPSDTAATIQASGQNISTSGNLYVTVTDANGNSKTASTTISVNFGAF
jgi:hypothetical protein